MVSRYNVHNVYRRTKPVAFLKLCLSVVQAEVKGWQVSFLRVCRRVPFTLLESSQSLVSRKVNHPGAWCSSSLLSTTRKMSDFSDTPPLVKLSYDQELSTGFHTDHYPTRISPSLLISSLALKNHKNRTTPKLRVSQCQGGFCRDCARTG